MKDDITEILDDLKNEDNYIEDYGFRYKRIALDDVWHLLDYITNLQKKYGKALELLADFNVPCEMVNCKIPDEYCEENCSDDYKKCWDKYIELELKEDNK